MKTIKIAAASIMLLTLGACATVSETMDKVMPSGVSATECFTAGGTIDSSGEVSMCKLSDGSSKPII